MPTVITVASFASQLNDVTKESSKQVVASSCFRHENPTNRAMLDSVLNGVSARLHQVFRYGRDEYTYGTPNGFVTAYASLDEEILKPIIEAEVGYPITIVEGILGPVQVEYFSMAHARRHWGYTYPGVRMPNDKIPHPNAYRLAPEKAVLLGDNKVKHGFSVSFTTETTNPTVGHPIPDEIFYHITFVREGQLSDPLEYWFYRKGSGIYPELEDQELNFGSPFLPIVPLREYNRNLGPELEYTTDDEGNPVVKYKRDANGNKIFPDTDLYRTSKKLLKKANLDMDEICKSIHTNPDIDDVDHAYVIFGINIMTKTTQGKNYIYQFFNNMADLAPNKGDVELKDANYRAIMGYDSCRKTIRNYGISSEINLIYSGDNLIIERRIDDNSHVRIKVTNLFHLNFIYDDDDGVVITKLSDVVSDRENYNFIIPLHYELTKEFRSLFARQDLVNESMQLVYNSVEKQKLKWYETGIFKIFIIVISIVFTVISAGTFAAAAIAAAQQGIGALVLLAFKTILVSVAVTYAGKLLADILPPEWLLVISIALSIITLSPTAMDALNSVNMMELVSGFKMAATKASSIQQDEIKVEAEEWAEYAKEQSDELEELWDELLEEGWIDFYEITSRDMIFIDGETPEEYYNRTIHTGNIGTTLYEVIPNYVDNKLQLPRLNTLK